MCSAHSNPSPAQTDGSACMKVDYTTPHELQLAVRLDGVRHSGFAPSSHASHPVELFGPLPTDIWSCVFPLAKTIDDGGL